MIRILVSSCLLGDRVRWDGDDAASTHPQLQDWSREGRLIPFCPEIHGGLTIPRPPAEAIGGGDDVLAGRARVLTDTQADVSRQFIAGGEGAVSTARTFGARLAILKDGSPSCGSTWIYDGTFSGTKVKGIGVTTALLRERLGLPVFSELQIDAAADYLRELSGHPNK